MIMQQRCDKLHRPPDSKRPQRCNSTLNNACRKNSTVSVLCNLGTITPLVSTASVSRDRKCSMPAMPSSFHIVEQSNIKEARMSVPALESNLTCNASGATNFAGLFAQQFFSKQLEEEILPESRLQKQPRRQPDKRNLTTERMDKLKERLTHYECHGLPKGWTLPQHLDLRLASNWEEVVRDSQKLCKESRLQQAAIWELLQTEVNFICLLRALVEVYMPCMEDLQQKFGLFENIDINRLFGNVKDIIEAACQLWKCHLLPCLKRAHSTGCPLDLCHFRDGFIHFDETMRPHAQFTIFRSDAKAYHESISKDEIFSEFVRWAQFIASSRCDWLPKSADISLESLLSQPWQRLQRYPMILKEIRRYTLDEEELNSICMMIEAAEEYCARVDRAVVSKEDEEELKSINYRLDEIKTSDLIDCVSDECQRIIQEYSHLDLLRPMAHCQRLRRKLHQAQLRLRDEKYKWLDVLCFLFTDMLLFTRPSKRGADRLKHVRSPVALNKVKLRRLNEGGGTGSISTNQGGASCLALLFNDFQSLAAVYIFSAEQKVLDEWIEKVNEAKKQFDADLVGHTPLSKEDSLFLASKLSSPLSKSAPNQRYSTLPLSIQRTQSEGSGCTLKQSVTNPPSVVNARHRSRTIGFLRHSSDLELQCSSTPHPSNIFNSRKLSSPLLKRKDKSSGTAPIEFIASGGYISTAIVNSDSPSISPPISPLVIPTENELSLDNQRRVCRTNKRYMTDSVREIVTTKDASIHKRLSWSSTNSTTTRLSNTASQSNYCADSIESVRSSSGFSSCGSYVHSVSELSESDGCEQTHCSDSFVFTDHDLLNAEEIKSTTLLMNSLTCVEENGATTV